jgi:hypothetical protein|tara:strand:+ start:1018 stop:1341 length:324 start_codon:yes stop_codon:yes gene_type:complete
VKRFDYEKIFILAHGRPAQMLDYYKEWSTGPNFIVNPKAIVASFWLTDRQKAEYLGICALRSYEDYKFQGITDLSLGSLPSWVPLTIVKENPLIQITDTQIIFLKEK